jgi:hypothetical protein
MINKHHARCFVALFMIPQRRVMGEGEKKEKKKG